MSDILKQIQSLKEDFMNLIEVEGLGDPSNEVPPSTNKIKRDRKTKDGKVEVVSVEDELFPYDGNKREQYRQKVLDTINNMIQGTATLEDLLQIVRQKKAPLKEAMELMEDVLSAINKSNKTEEEKDKLYDKIKKASYTELKDSELRKARDPRFKSSNVEARYWTKKDHDDGREQKKREEDKKFEMNKHGRPIYTRNGEIVPFAEAMEILEKYTEAQKKSAAEKSFPKRKEELNKVADELDDIMKKNDYEYSGDIHIAQPKGWPYGKSQLNKDVEDKIGEYKRVLNRAHAAKKVSEAPLKEALDLVEAIKDEVKNHHKYTDGSATFSYKGNDYSYSPKKNILGGLRKEGKTKDDRNPVKQAVDSSNKEFEKARKYNYDTERQSRAVGKKINKEVAKLEKTEGKGAFPGKTNDTIKKLIDTANVIKANRADADKNFTEINKRQQDMADDAKGVKHQMYDIWNSKKGDNFGWKPIVKTSEALGESLTLMEQIINEISDKTANSFLEKRVINALDAWYNNDDLNKKEDDAVKALIKRKRRQGKELSDDEKKRIEEAVISELHPDTVNNALDKRTEQSIEADDKERDEFNNILKIKDRDERAKAYKEFKKKADDRFAKEDKKLDLYFNYAKRHPELVKESLRDQIDKKIKAGEINLDKALKLDKKIEDKMSSEKNAQEYSDELDKRAKKERLGDKAIVKSIKRNERKGACEALELAEAIINEVSLKTWKEAAKNSIDKRKEAAENTAKTAEQSWNDYEEFSRKHPEEEDALYKRAWRNDIIAKKAEDRADHASDVLGIKAKGKSANKTIKAARNSETKRNDEYLQNSDPDKFNRLRTRMMKSDQLITADPVKSRAYESLEEALRLLEGLFVNDGKGDLIDNDIMNKPGWTRKTIENGITKVAKGFQKNVDNKKEK